MIKIKLERILVDGKPCVRIAKIRALEEGSLPKEYLESGHHMYYRRVGDRSFLHIKVRPGTAYTLRNVLHRGKRSGVAFIGGINLFSLQEGSTLSKEAFKLVQQEIEACGERLAQINKARREDEIKEWLSTPESVLKI